MPCLYGKLPSFPNLPQEMRCKKLLATHPLTSPTRTNAQSPRHADTYTRVPLGRKPTTESSVSALDVFQSSLDELEALLKEI